MCPNRYAIELRLRPLFVLVLTLALTPIMIILIVLVFRLCGRLLILLLPHHDKIEDILALALRHSSWQHTRAFDPRQSRVRRSRENMENIKLLAVF